MVYYDKCCTQFLENYRHLNIGVYHLFKKNWKYSQFSTWPIFMIFSLNKQKTVLYKFVVTQIMFVIKK